MLFKASEEKNEVINGKQICYVEIGQSASPVLILIVGLGMQLVEWPVGFIQALSRKYRLVLLDNRDAGKSARYGPVHEETAKNFDWHLSDIRGMEYDLFDMAVDIIDLADHLSIRKFSCIGFSMGGMIAQIVAAQHRERVEALACLCSSGGTLPLGATKEAESVMNETMHNARHDIETYTYRLFKSSQYFLGNAPFDTKKLFIETQKLVERSYNPGGIFRQAKAIYGTTDRQKLLEQIHVPTLILHGMEDTCIHHTHAENTKRLISLARLELLPKHGHYLSDELGMRVLNWLAEVHSK
ncbi:alpha/beta fold hydrolase [Curvivirga aplysinae]|uniref:alpha/beta fold hydrolase n=1 Tax=Curvivirga aplysinae TaxID=2529852 RepID=UPI0012BBE7E0|nr:alpha/beta hydrolase [Curvivirga aplysinae]MTI08741.1 alpha/beta hydrolase [Curvivirga aplysinae]